MSSILDCCNPCGTVQNTQVPGSEGAPGTDGTNGVNAYTTLEQDFIVVASPAESTVDVGSSVWMVIGQIIVIGSGFVNPTAGGPAHFIITGIPSSTSVSIVYIGSIGDVAPGETISDQATISPSAA